MDKIYVQLGPYLSLSILSVNRLANFRVLKKIIVDFFIVRCDGTDFISHLILMLCVIAENRFFGPALIFVHRAFDGAIS